MTSDELIALLTATHPQLLRFGDNTAVYKKLQAHTVIVTAVSCPSI